MTAARSLTAADLEALLGAKQVAPILETVAAGGEVPVMDVVRVCSAVIASEARATKAKGGARCEAFDAELLAVREAALVAVRAWAPPPNRG